MDSSSSTMKTNAPGGGFDSSLREDFVCTARGYSGLCHPESTTGQACHPSGTMTRRSGVIGLWSYGRHRYDGRRLSVNRIPTAMKATALFSSIIVALVGACFAHAPRDTPEKAAIVANDRAFEAAYAKADVKALAAFFTEDAEYTSDNGRKYTGRPAIEESLRAAFLANKGAKLAIDVDSVRALSPEILVEKGSTTVTSKNGETSGALYKDAYTQKDGSWKISELVETPLPDTTPHDRLAELAWLV